MRNILVTLFLLCSTILLGQQPAYFKIGEKELEGVDIYDIIQDNKGLYWISSSEGIYNYDGYTFEHVTVSGLLNQSVFDFVKNDRGEIFAFNLTHQIIRIKEKSISIIYQIPKQYQSNLYDLKIDNNGDLLINAKAQIKISNQKGEIGIKEFDRTDICKGTIQYKSVPDSAYQIYCKSKPFQGPNNCWLIYILPKNNTNSERRLTWVTLKGRQLAVEEGQFNVYEYFPETGILKWIKKLPIDRLSCLSKLYEAGNMLWVGGGASFETYIFDENLSPIDATNTSFSEYKVSKIYEDQEQNILVGTFKHGILVIPNTDLLLFPKQNAAGFVKLVADPKGGLFCANEFGEVYKLTTKKGLQNLDIKFNSKVSESFFYWPIHQTLIANDKSRMGYSNVHEKKLKYVTTGSVKDFTIVHDSLAYLALNAGVQKVIVQQDKLEIPMDFILRERTFRIAHNKLTKWTYVSTTEGIKCIDPQQNIHVPKIEGGFLFIDDFYQENNTIFALSRNKGIYKLDKGNPIKWCPINDNGSKFKIYNNLILIQNRTGISIYSLNGVLLQELNHSFGIEQNQVNDFEIVNDTLFIAKGNGILLIPMNKLLAKTPILEPEIEAVLVNDKPMINNKLNADERKVEFRFRVNTLRYSENTTYWTKLDGYDKAWKEIPFHQRSVVYNALPDGEYSFKIKSKNNHQFSSPVSVSFSISAPFYKHWWFYLMLTLSISSVLYFVFKWQLTVVRRKARVENQLNSSRLTAIQSQMNPHFIFNSLTSIQDFVLQSDIENAYSYIAKFAKLVRNILKHSDKEFIDIEDEVFVLRLYLSLEKLRFKSNLDYTITCSAQDVLIPPMLIQPFIENALIHGLLHKKGTGRLTVYIEAHDQTLMVIIEDNGIGREKARQIQHRQNHESFATKGIKKRFQILKAKYKEDIGFTYDDLFDQKGNAIGTRVTLNIPIKHNY